MPDRHASLTARERAMHALGGALALTVLAFAGCTLGPDYERPATPDPGFWRTSLEGSAEAIDVEWWHGFGDPILESLVREALENNYDVRIAASRVEEFAARVGITRSEAFPEVTYDASASREQQSAETPIGRIPGGERVGDFFQARLNVGWELDVWGRIARATEAARAELLASEETRRAIVLSLVSTVATSYIGLRSLDEQLEIANSSLESRAATVDLFTLQREGGVVSDLELAQIRSEYERTAASIPPIERDIALLENSLSVLLGRPPGPIERGVALNDLEFPEIPAGLPSELLQRRPDLRAAEQALIASNARIGEAIAGFYPRIALTASGGLASDDISNLFSGSAGIYSLAASLAGPIFDAGRTEGRVQVAEAVQRQQLDTYVGTILTALRESEDALVTQTTTRDEVAAQGRQVDALQQYASVAKRRYDNGYTGYLSVLDSERTLFDAQLQQARLRADSYTSIIGIYKALGGGWVDVATDRADLAQRDRVESRDERDPWPRFREDLFEDGDSPAIEAGVDASAG